MMYVMIGNKVYYANRQLFNSSLISRNSKLQIYRTLVRPVVTYGSESWTLSMEEERTLAVLERKILRKIYGPVKENELWRIRRNDELEAIIKGENIVRLLYCSQIGLRFIEFLVGEHVSNPSFGSSSGLQDVHMYSSQLLFL